MSAENVAKELFGIIALMVKDGVVGALVRKWLFRRNKFSCFLIKKSLATYLMQVFIDDVILLRLRANVLCGRHAVQMHLMENGSFWAHPRMLRATNAVMEHLTLQ